MSMRRPLTFVWQGKRKALASVRHVSAPLCSIEMGIARPPRATSKHALLWGGVNKKYLKTTPCKVQTMCSLRLDF